MKHKRMSVIAAILVLVLTALTVIPAVAVETPSLGRYVITIPEGKKLLFRGEPSSDSPEVDYLANGEVVEVVEIQGTWGRARQNGKDGWFAVKYGTLRTKYDMAALIADISAANAESVDFGKLASAGVKGVILRVGVRMNTTGVIAEDLGFEANYKAARAAGLKVGLFFSSSAMESAQIVEEVNWVLGRISAVGAQLALPVFYAPYSAAKKSLSRTVNTRLASEFCKALEDKGVQAGVYLPYDWTTKNIGFDTLGNYAHWIADYGDYCNFTASYDIWQYVEFAAADGVSGKIGLSYMFRDVTVPGVMPEPTSEPTSETPSEPTSETPSETPSQTEAPTTSVVPVPEHKEGAFRTVVAPGCETWGMEAAFCEDCGALLHTRLIPPVGHTEGPWVRVSEATETQKGLAFKYCTVCGQLVREHPYGLCDKEHLHAYGPWTVVDGASVLIEDAQKYPDAGAGEPMTAPAEEGVTAVPADKEAAAIDPALVGKYPCTSQREQILVCAECGELLERTYALPAAHTPAAAHSVTPADCETEGHDATVCAVCGAVIEDVITPAYGHSVKDWTVVRAATKDSDGERRGVCLRCGKTVNETIPAPTVTRGDVNEDGKVNSTDARMILQAAARTLSFTDAQIAAGDVDGSGKITAADARTVLRVSAKLQTLD